MNVENKPSVAKKLLEVVEFIEENQNSPEMQAYKRMLLKIAGTMINGLAELPESSYDNCQPQCDSDQCSCEFNQGDPQQRPQQGNFNLMPSEDVQKTIDDIRKEMGKDGKAED